MKIEIIENIIQMNFEATLRKYATHNKNIVLFRCVTGISHSNTLYSSVKILIEPWD